MDVAARLVRMLDRLDDVGIYPEDRAGVEAIVRGVLNDPVDLARVQELCDDLVLPSIGRYTHIWDQPGFPNDTREHRLGRGALPLCALIATADDVVAYQVDRGAPEEFSRRMITDLGQQVMKDRLVNGSTGLHNQDWLLGIWHGGMLWIGRLQFELAQSRLGGPDTDTRQWVLSVHIPETGPLRPDEVDDCFAQAPEVFNAMFPESAPVAGLVCHSWLLDPVLIDLVPGSNLADFASRWQVWQLDPKDRDALYFAFHVEPTPERDLMAEVALLPEDSRLHRALIELWRSGGHIRLGHGFIPVGQLRGAAR